MVAAAVVTLVAGGAQAKNRDPGPADHRQLTPGEFDRVVIAGPFVVRVRTGKATSVFLSGPRTMLDDTEFRVRDGQLLVGWQEGASWSRNGDQGVDIDITMPVIRGVTNLGAGSIDIDRVQTDEFAVSLPSAGGVTIHSADVGRLKADVGGSATLGLDQIEAKAVDFGLFGSGEIRAAGRVDTANLTLGGSGSFDNPHLTARNATIIAAGPCAVRAAVTDTADINSLGPGDIVLTGGAKCIVQKSGAGDVRCS